MPPRFPHGLRRKPTDMSIPEIAIFTALASSIGAGVYQLATSPWGETSTGQGHEMKKNSSCLMKRPIKSVADGNKPVLLKSDDDTTIVELGK
mmetsp:Transcript_19614/g.26926  ORF Transcript_19614/g.26926 Transcript_19614/m.26926 type:complete len:92 (+) Transcript_19614:138-413(+)|eukprot:CAMPEP_0185733718 /NCGR_PEP_ID=MMETSP1171-20130828/20373_1 /TAXON_ID=374046 /ORGANISM="Helicotheca tamensis, Strain CCMP826" /LENGTH=91 /DNA_ID=CAMNT_0028403517 /DNA_START=86 /DNA_END=361 /DNA_ORIENTATION=+